MECRLRSGFKELLAQAGGSTRRQTLALGSLAGVQSWGSCRAGSARYSPWQLSWR